MLAGPLADFVLPGPFLAGAPRRAGRPTHPGARLLVERLSSLADGSDTLVVLETEPRLGLAGAGMLLARDWFVAPLYGRWPAEGAVLPTERLCGWLSWLADDADSDTAKSADEGADTTGRGRGALCLLLDAERGRRVSVRTLRRRFDNRYGYLAHMLPPAPRLKALGVRRVVWAGATAGVAPELAGYAESLIEARIVVEAVRLVAARERRRRASAARR